MVFIVGQTVTARNVNDSVLYLDLMEHVHTKARTVMLYLCPDGKELRLRRLSRSASRLILQNQADKRDCAGCSLRDKCLHKDNKSGARKASVGYFAADDSATWISVMSLLIIYRAARCITATKPEQCRGRSRACTSRFQEDWRSALQLLLQEKRHADRDIG